MVTININGFPLVHEADFENPFDPNDSSTQGCFLKPEFKFLSDEDYVHAGIKAHIEEGDSYLVGMEVISDTWVCPAYCSQLLQRYGLVLKEASPMLRKERLTNQAFLFLKFEHIAFEVSTPLIVTAQTQK